MITLIFGFQRELELGRHGLKLLKRSPSSFTPCLDGRYLLLGPDQDLNHSEISKFSKHDADAYPRLFVFLANSRNVIFKSNKFFFFFFALQIREAAREVLWIHGSSFGFNST